MVKRLIILLLSLSITFPAWACDKPVLRLLKNEKAPCEGFLFSPEKELELRLLDTEHKFLLKAGQVKNNLIEFYKTNEETTYEIIEKERQKSEVWRNVAEKNTLELVKTQESRGQRDWLFFVGGILCIVAAGWSLGQVAK